MSRRATLRSSVAPVSRSCGLKEWTATAGNHATASAANTPRWSATTSGKWAVLSEWETVDYAGIAVYGLRQAMEQVYTSYPEDSEEAVILCNRDQ